jgi:GMP synthase (glutamine-hydrolysing)
MTQDTLVILDFGSQYTQLITRLVRDQSVFCQQLPWNANQSTVVDLNPRGIILSGGPASIYMPDAPTLPHYLLDLGVPLLGICYGMQALTHALGGEVIPSTDKEYGKSALEVSKENLLIPKGTHVAWMSHGDRIKTLPPGFISLAKTENSPLAAMGDPTRQFYGVQFHPEVKHTPIGEEIVRNFLFNICRVNPGWTPESIIDQSIDQIKNQVGPSRVLSAASGGVDSSVATALVYKAIGTQLESVFVDTGLLRKDEQKQVILSFQESLGMQLHTVQAADLFFQDLKGITDPEQKRSKIGNRFIRIFEEQARALAYPEFLVQGTIYPDVVESYSADRVHTETIKTHHNVGGLPEEMDFKLVEPLRYLFKDEVRKIGKALGLPDSLVWRQPFPGPGLAIRCLGEVTQERVERLRAADNIFISELEKADLMRTSENSSIQGTSQSFAVLLPVKTVGVMGDQRTYEDVIALRAVTTDDFMTADWSRLPAELLARISNRVVNEVPGVNRVVYDITSKPPGTIEWE